MKMAGTRYMIQNTDIFTPIVDDPYIQGKIAACNITNDVFACGALDIRSMLCFLAAPSTIPGWVLTDILMGMKDFLKDLECEITGGHTIINPWILLGGTATGFTDERYLIRNTGMKPGDILILTKALGTQPAMALHRVIKRPEFLENVMELVPRSELQGIVDNAIEAMVTTNKPAVEVIHELIDESNGQFKVNAMTDVTGFGLAGHAENLAKASRVDVEISRIPHFKWTMELSEMMGYDLANARSAETAGGLLIALNPKHQERLENALEARGIPHYLVGRAISSGTGKVHVSSKVIFQPI